MCVVYCVLLLFCRLQLLCYCFVLFFLLCFAVAQRFQERDLMVPVLPQDTASVSGKQLLTPVELAIMSHP